MNSSEEKGIKQKEVEARRVEVERLHIQGLSVSEMAAQLGVDVRTVSRDIQENRAARLKMLEGSDEARAWLQDKLADSIAFYEEARRVFYSQSLTFNAEAARSRALWFAVQVENQKIENIKTLIWSLYDLQAGGHNLRYGEEH